MYINMGPSHPARHGTVKMVCSFYGDRGQRGRAGGLPAPLLREDHRQHKTWNQVIPATADQCQPPHQQHGLLPGRGRACWAFRCQCCDYIRTVMVPELSRIGDHLTCIAASAMEMGALTAFLDLQGPRDSWQLIEQVTGAAVIYQLRARGAAWCATCRPTLPSAGPS